MPPPGAGPTAEEDERAHALLEQTISGRYRLEHVIATSEIGAVYRAEHVAMRLRVVVKILHPGAPEDAVARFEREAIAGAHVRHTNVAAATDFGKLEDGSHFLVIEHVAGTTLREVLQKGKLPLSRALSVARQLAAGLSAAHEQGVVHRDVQPGNVMLSGAGGDQVKLIDFGLAKVDLPADAGDDAGSTGGAGGQRGKALTVLGARVGLGAYSAPEGARGLNALDARSDLYSLGMVLYEMLAGRRPFAAEAPDQLFAEQRRVDPPPLPLDLDVPASLEATVLRLMDRDPARRYASAQEAMEALVAAVPSAPPARSFAPRRRASPSAGHGAAEKIQGLARRALDLGGRGADFLARRIAFTRRGKTLRVPVWALAVLLALPLVLTVAGLALRGPGAPSAQAMVSAAPAARIETPPAPTSAEPSPTDTASVLGATRAASSAGAGPGLEGLDPTALRGRLRDFTTAKDWGRAAKAFDALAKIDPAALRETQVASSVASLAVALETTGGEDADAVFDLLSTRTGGPGLEILFEMVRSRGGTKGSKRAAALLRKPEVSARLPKPLRIAFELRDAPCDKKPSLYARAVEEGDHMALTELRVMREAECDRRRAPEDPCCFAKAPLDQAIKDLRAKLAK
jgi:serine/threonine-protein kinase